MSVITLLSRFVTVEQIVFTRELQDITLTEANVTVTFECEISKDNLKVEWYYDGKKISRIDNYDISSDGKLHKLVINKAVTDNAGKYSAKYKEAETTASLSIQGINICILFIKHNIVVIINRFFLYYTADYIKL